ncbi:copper amine oxidase N-terminal domain-containing protein [Paenibacillaceae bacterium]|nr:copper amine oxidase N-terminal domain-containing protein [Paenibacillaceae bacterium]
MRLFKKWKLRGAMMLLLAAVMLVAAGCQAIGGVDFNAMLKQSLKVTSMEGKQTFEVELLLKDTGSEQLDEEMTALIKMFSHIKVQLNDIKVQNASNTSMTGELQLGDKSVGFAVKMSDEWLVVTIDGAKRPFRFSMTDASYGALLSGGYVEGENTETAVNEETHTQMMEIGKKIIDHLGGYMIDNLPNPKQLSVTPASQTINGESVSLMHIQAKLDGPELWAWGKKYVDALIADKEGLSDMLTNIFELLSSEKEVFNALGMNEITDELSGSKEEQGELIRQTVEDIISMLSDMRDEMLETEKNDADFINELFNSGLQLKYDIYIDSKLDIRKTATEFIVKPEFDAEDESFASELPFEGIAIRSTAEQWNVNGEVESDAPVVSSFDLTEEQLFDMESYQFVKQFDTNSVVYDLLKNQFGFSKQSVYLYSEYEDNPPIVTPDGTTLMPLRNLANGLGDWIGYDPATKTYVLFDKGTNQTLQLRNGSKDVVVNDKTETWSFPVTIIGNTMYVPASDIAQVLNGTVTWDNTFEDYEILIFEREL